jgi:hypothetical protein
VVLTHIIAIEELEDKCLITQSYDGSFIEMHDLLQEVGKAIVRQESPNEPSKRSRLWFHEDVWKVVEGNKVKKNVLKIPFNFTYVTIEKPHTTGGGVWEESGTRLGGGHLDFFLYLIVFH